MYGAGKGKDRGHGMVEEGSGPIIEEGSGPIKGGDIMRHYTALGKMALMLSSFLLFQTSRNGAMDLSGWNTKQPFANPNKQE